MATNVLVLTCKGRKDLTEQCFRSMVATLPHWAEDDPNRNRPMFIIVDAGAGDQAIDMYERIEWLDHGNVFAVRYRNRPCTLTEGWNAAIDEAALSAKVSQEMGGNGPEKYNIHLLQNDSIFLKPGWLDAIAAKLIEQPNIGSVGTSGMSVFGHPFVTGAVQSFVLSNALAVAENGKVIDEVFNHAFPDVDLCIRFTRAGYYNTIVADMEHGPDPAVKHLVSQTMYSEHGVDRVMEMRAEEEKYFLAKWGKAE